MEENLLYVILGALAAVLATLTLLSLSDFWVQTALPLWRRWRYRGVNIAGGWKGLGTGHLAVPGEWTEVGVVLEQQLREVRGLLAIRHCSAGGCSELRVPVAGTICGGYLHLGPSPENEGGAALATALLKIEGRGASLNGQLLYRETAEDMISGIQMSVHRAESMALPRMRPIGAATTGLAAAAASP